MRAEKEWNLLQLSSSMLIAAGSLRNKILVLLFDGPKTNSGLVGKILFREHIGNRRIACDHSLKTPYKKDSHQINCQRTSALLK